MDRVLLELEVHAIVGILPRERVEPQPMRIAIAMGLDLQGCGETGDLARSVDYGEVDAQVRFLAVHGRFRLIESLALAIARLVLLPPTPGEARAAVETVSVTIRKPTVLRAAEPGVSLERTASVLDGERIVSLPEVRARRVRGARPSAGAVYRVRDDLWLALDAEEPGPG